MKYYTIIILLILLLILINIYFLKLHKFLTKSNKKGGDDINKLLIQSNLETKKIEKNINLLKNRLLDIDEESPIILFNDYGDYIGENNYFKKTMAIQNRDNYIRQQQQVKPIDNSRKARLARSTYVSNKQENKNRQNQYSILPKSHIPNEEYKSKRLDIQKNALLKEITSDDYQPSNPELAYGFLSHRNILMENNPSIYKSKNSNSNRQNTSLIQQQYDGYTYDMRILTCRLFYQNYLNISKLHRVGEDEIDYNKRVGDINSTYNSKEFIEYGAKDIDSKILKGKYTIVDGPNRSMVLADEHQNILLEYLSMHNLNTYALIEYNKNISNGPKETDPSKAYIIGKDPKYESFNKIWLIDRFTGANYIPIREEPPHSISDEITEKLSHNIPS